MRLNWNRLLIHFVGAGLVGAPLVYWTIRVMTSPPALAPASVHAVTAHDPDPVLLARAFGQVEVAAPAALANIQVAGVYAGGRESAAVFVVGDGPPVAVRLGEEVAPGLILAEVDAQSVTLDSGGVRRQLRLPNLPVATSGSRAAEPRAGLDPRHGLLAAPTPGALPRLHSTATRSSAAVLAPRPEPRPELSPESPDRQQVVGTSLAR